MTKETRVNLLFLGIILAISLPGAVILFKKKLDPSVPPSYLPETTRTRLPYNMPMEAGDKERFVPTLTGRWVEERAREHGLAEVVTRDGLPVMSEGRRAQLVGSVKADGGTDAAVLIWGDVTPETVHAVARQDGATITGAIKAIQILPLPEDVRKELVYAGFAKPPKVVSWCTISLPGLTDYEKSAVLTLSETGMASNSVTLFTK